MIGEDTTREPDRQRSPKADTLLSLTDQVVAEDQKEPNDHKKYINHHFFSLRFFNPFQFFSIFFNNWENLNILYYQVTFL